MKHLSVQVWLISLSQSQIVKPTISSEKQFFFTAREKNSLLSLVNFLFFAEALLKGANF